MNDIIGEIEDRIDGLREDSVKAEEYLRLRDRFRELEINITLRNIEKLEESNNAVREDMTRLAETIEELSARKRELDQKIEKSRAENENLEQLASQARDKLLASVEEINKLTNKSQLDAERLNSIDRDLARVGEEISSSAKKKRGRKTTQASLRLRKRKWKIASK